MGASKTSVIRQEPNAVSFVIGDLILLTLRGERCADRATKHVNHDT